MISCIVTTAGAIEEDFIKCMHPTYVGEFTTRGTDLRKRGLNRIGNLVIPNQNYCSFEDWLLPLLDTMLKEQQEDGAHWSPSTIIHRLGKEIDNPESIYYWCYKNDIPVFCPAITDGSLGDMMFFHSINNPGLVVDILEDLRRINNLAIAAHKTGCIILGSGLIKHHICNANLMRNGTDYAVYVNTAQEYDGSDAGATPDEAVSWGKISLNAKSVKVHADATIVFPIMVAQTFAKMFHEKK
jgi:deoxyhypusine synthase